MSDLPHDLLAEIKALRARAEAAEALAKTRTAEAQSLAATLAAVREIVDYPGAKAIEVNRRILAILDGEGEK